jgi:GGDEF domain-containing protein
VQGYGIELGDELLSIQLILTREAERRGDAPRPRRDVRPEVRHEVRHAQPHGGSDRLGMVEAGMVDALTGTGTARALRRDLMLERTWPTAGAHRQALAALRIEPLEQIRLSFGSDAADLVLKAFVEVAPFILEPRDRIYRVARDQFVLVQEAAGRDGPEVARSGLEASLRRVLVDRGLPEVRIGVRPVNAASLLPA